MRNIGINYPATVAVGASFPASILERGLWPLQAIDQALGSLPALTLLNLGQCKHLQTLPDTLGELSSLRSLVLDDIYFVCFVYFPRLGHAPAGGGAAGEVSRETPLIFKAKNTEECDSNTKSMLETKNVCDACYTSCSRASLLKMWKAPCRITS
jgi:hypothetical protein